jgi:20S proteasome alpha/beta subunit
MSLYKRYLQKNAKKPVTIAIGILAKKTIWMAADSQTTRDDLKIIDARKISILHLSDAKALIAEAGSAAVCQRIIEVMETMAKTELLKDYRTVADIAQKAMAAVRNELRFQPGFPI